MKKLMTLLTILSIQFPIFSQTVKPNISFLNEGDYSGIEGCSYSMDDWKGNTFIVATYPFSDDQDNHYLYIKIDGKIWKLSYKVIEGGKDETTLQVFPLNQPFHITMSTPKWKKIGAEFSIGKSRLEVHDTRNITTTKLWVRAMYGC